MGDSLDFMRLPAGLGFPDWIRNLPLAILRDLNARAAEQGRVLYEAGKVEGLIWAKNQVGGRVDGVQVTVATLPLRTGLAAAASVLASAPRTWAELVADRPTPEATGALGLLVAGLHHLARGALECATCRGTCPHVFALVYEATRVAATSPRHLLRLVGSSLPELAEAVEAERSTGGSRWTDGVGAFASPADAKEVVETAEPGAPRPLPAALGGPAAEAWIEAVRRSCIEAGPDLLERLANRRSVGSVPVPPIGPAPFWRIDLQAVQKRMDRAAVIRWALHRVHVLRLWGWPRLDEAAQALFAPRRVAELSVRWSEAELLLALQVLPAGCFSASQLHLGKALGRSPVLDRELVTTLARLAPREALAAMSGWIRAPEPGTQDLERLRGVVRALPGLCGQPGAAAVADELFLRLAHGPGAAELRRRLFVQLGRVALAFARPELGELVASAFGAGEGPLCVRLAASLAPETAWAAHYPYLGQALEGFALDTLGAFLPKLPAKRFEPLLCGTPAGIRDLAKNPAGLVGPQRPELGTLLKAVLGARKSLASALWRPAIALVLATHWVEEPCLDDSTTAELVRIATPPVSPGEAWRQRLAEALATRPRAEVVDAIFARSLQARNVIDVVMEGNLLALCAALGWPELASLLVGGLGHQSGVVASRALLGVLALGPTAQDELGQLEFRPEEEFDPVFGAYCWLADPAAEVRLVEAFRATKGRVLTARAFELRSLPTPGVVAALDAALGETPADAGLAGVVAELQEVVNVKAPVLDGRGTVKVNAYFPNLSTRTEDGWDEEDLPVRLPGDPVLFGAGVRAGVESNRPALSGLDPEEEPGTANRAGKVGRNDPCPCGSGKKFKKCCLG